VALGFALSPSLVSGPPDGAAGAAVGAGNRLKHYCAVLWENSGALVRPTLSKGGVAGSIRADEDIGTTTVNGITVYRWVDAEIAAMVGTALAESGSNFPAASGFCEWTLEDCSATEGTYGQGTNAGTSALNATSPNPPVCDLAIALATMSTAGIRVNSTATESFTEVFDADTGGANLGAYLSHFADYPGGALNLTLSGVTTRGQVIVMAFNEDLGSSGAARLIGGWPLRSLVGGGLVR
jgi:hypothetical protein